MMRVLIISDTHGHLDNLRKVVKKIRQVDYCIHCGDVEGDEDVIPDIVGAPCVFVRGNNDFGGNLPKERIVTLEGHRIFVTHGHYYGVAWDTKTLVDLARKFDCEVAMYGHTHRPDVTIATKPGGVTVINPGSLQYPRQDGRKPSYIVMEIDRFGKLHFTVNYLARSGKISFWG